MKVFVTGVGGQLGHDVMNELAGRGHAGVGSDIAPAYSGIQDGTAVCGMPYVQLDITDADAVRRVLDEAMRVLDAGEAEVEIRVPHASMQVPLRQIVAVVASNHALEIVLTDGRRLRGTTTFSGLCRQLESDGRFLLLNRGVLVNMDEVLSLQQDAMRMKTGDMFPIRTRGRGELISRFTQYQIARMRRGSHS